MLLLNIGSVCIVYFSLTLIIDITVEFDPVVYGPITEGAQQSIAFRIVAQPPPAGEITVLFSTLDGTATGMYGNACKNHYNRRT